MFAESSAAVVLAVVLGNVMLFASVVFVAVDDSCVVKIIFIAHHTLQKS